MEPKDIEDILSEKEFDELEKLITEDSKYNKLSRKRSILLDKVGVILDELDSRSKEYVKKFALKKDVEFFKKRLAKYYGYMRISTRRRGPISLQTSRLYLTPDIYFVDWGDNASGVRVLGHSAAASGYSYWTEILLWAKVKGREKLMKKVSKLSTKIDKLNKKMNRIEKSLIKSHIKKNFSNDEFERMFMEILKLSNSQNEKLEKAMSILAISGGTKEFSKQMTDITGGSLEYTKVMLKLRKDMKQYYKNGVIPVLNSKGDVEPLITAEQMRDSLINLTFQKYEDELNEYAKEFKTNLKLYAEKYADSKIDLESDGDDYEDESNDSDMDEDS